MAFIRMNQMRGLSDDTSSSAAAQPVQGRSIEIMGMSPSTALLAGAGLLLGVGILSAVFARGGPSPKKRNPGAARNGRFYSTSPTDSKGRLIGKPYSRGVLKRKMETDKTLKGMAKGMIRWAAKQQGIGLTDRQVTSMLGKAPKDLRGTICGVKRADIKRRADSAFYGRARKLHALHGTKTVKVEPAKGKKGKKTKTGVAKKAKRSSKKKAAA